MQTIEAAAQRMREARQADPSPPPPPAYSPKLRPAPAALEIKTRVLGELAAASPAASAPVAAAAASKERMPWRWMLASAGVGAAMGVLLQMLWHGATAPAEPAAVASRAALPTVPASVAVPVAAVAAARPADSVPPAAPVAAGGAAVAPVTATPAPAAAVAAPVADDASEVRERVTHWIAAWSARDVERYLAFYAQDFTPGGGLSRAAWEAQRRARLSGAAGIQVAARDVRVESQGADRVVVRFAQDYAAGSYRETGTRKRLVMRREDGRWRIVSEGSDA